MLLAAVVVEAIAIVDFPPAGVGVVVVVVRWIGMMIFLGATTVRAMGLAGIALEPSLGFSLLAVVSANSAPEQAAESSSSRWVRLSDLLLVVLELRLLVTDDRLVVRRELPNMAAGLPPPRIRLVGGAELPLLLLVVLHPDSLSTPSSSAGLHGHRSSTQITRTYEI